MFSSSVFVLSRTIVEGISFISKKNKKLTFIKYKLYLCANFIINKVYLLILIKNI